MTQITYLDCVLDALDLDGDDGEDLDGDAVELVEAAPGASLRQALVDVAARHVVHLGGWLVIQSYDITLLL